MRKAFCFATCLTLLIAAKAAFPVETNTITPWLKSVWIEPAAPEVGQDITVFANIEIEKTYSRSKILEVLLNYSTDSGKTWAEVEMSTMEGKNWTGLIPGQPNGSEVLFYIRSGDSIGNVFTELPCDVSAWPPKNDSCMVPTAASLSMMEWSIPGAPDNMMITDLRAGRDSDYLYFTMKAAGYVEPGTISPFNLHCYAIIIFNTDSWPITDQFKEGWAYAYAPLLGAVGYVKTDMKNGCVLAKKQQNGNGIDFNAEPVDCMVNGEYLYMKIAKKSFRGMDSKTRFMAYTGIWNDINNFLTTDGVLTADYSRFTLLRPASHRFTVGEK